MKGDNRKNNGGKRPGAGRTKGRKNDKTLEKEKVEAAINQKIFKIADSLIISQATLAKGSISVFEKVRFKEGKESKSKLVLVEDTDVIMEVLEETDGCGGVVDDRFYVILTNKPDNQAINSLMDRALGKARQNIGLDGGKEGAPIKVQELETTLRELGKK